MSDIYMRILLSAQDSASSIIKNVASAISGSDGLGGALLGIGAAVGVAAIGIGVTAVKAAGTFQNSLTSLVTGAGESQKNLAMVGNGILSMAVQTGTATSQLTSGMYQIESAGYHGSAGLQVLQASAEGAKVGSADLGTVAGAVTTVLTDYHLSASQANSTTSGLIETVASGKTHLQDLASSLGSVLPLASSLGISFPQVAGAIATMTNTGMDAQRASMNLSNAISSLSAPTAGAVKSMTSVGLSAQELKNTMSTKGLTGAIQLVEEHVGKTFPAGSVAAVTAFKSIMGGVTGYKVALMLGGKSMETFQSNVSNISDAMKNGTSSVQGWNRVQQDFNFKMAQAQEVVETLMIRIGQALLPVLTNLVSATIPLISSFSNWLIQSNAIPNAISAIGIAIQATIQFITSIVVGFIQWNDRTHFIQNALSGLQTTVTTTVGVVQTTISVVQSVVGWFIQWHTPILVVAGAITLFFLPALLKIGIQAAITGTQIATSFIANLIKTGVESVVAGTKMTISFVASMAKAGIEAVVNGAKVTVSFVASVIKAGVEAWVQGPKIVASFVSSIVQSGTAAVVNGAKVTVQFVGSVIKSGTEAVIAGTKVTIQFVGAIIKTGAEAVIAGAKVTAQFIASVVKAGISAVVTAAQFVGSLIPAIVSFVAEAVVAAVTAIPGLVMGFGAWAIGAAGAAVATIAATWPILLIIGAIALLVVGIILLVTHWKQVAAFLQSVWQNVTTWLIGALHSIENVFHAVWNGIVSFLHQAWAVIVNVVKTGAMLLLAIILGPTLLIVMLVIQHWTQIRAFIAAAIAVIAGIVRAGWNLLIEIIGTVIAFLKNLISTFWNDEVTGWQTLMGMVHTIVTNLWNGVVDRFNNAKSTLGNTINALWNGLIGIMNGWPAQALQAGINIVNGIANGIKNAVGAVTSAIGSVTSAIGKYLPHSPAEQGELAHLNEYGPTLVKSISAGILGEMPTIQSTLNVMTRPFSQIATTAPRPGGMTAASATGGNTIIFSPNVTLRGLDEESLEQAGRWMITYLGEEIRQQFGNV